MMASETTRRGYGTRHQKLRAKEDRALKRAGQVPCARCGWPVFHAWPLDPPEVHVPNCPQRSSCQGQCWSTWDLGHTDDRTAYSGIEHTCCNRAAGARNSHAKRAATPRPPKAEDTGPVRDYGW